MEKSTTIRRLLLDRLVLSILLALFFSGGRAAFGQDNWDVYRNAVKDASIYNRNKVLALHPLRPENGKVRVVTFTSFAYPDRPYPQMYHTPQHVFVWVTPDGEVRDACRQFRLTDDQLILRLNQLLGLKPNTRYTQFIVLSVPADRVFRPTPDPDTTTVFPCADTSDSQCGNKFPSAVSLTHKSWFADQSISSYRIGQDPVEDGFPWTHLGYTYNWAPYAASKYGASEYVIMENTDVTIVSKFSTAEYCSGGGSSHSSGQKQ